MCKCSITLTHTSTYTHLSGLFSTAGPVSSLEFHMDNYVYKSLVTSPLCHCVCMRERGREGEMDGETKIMLLCVFVHACLPRAIASVHFMPMTTCMSILQRYNGEGHVTNITLPTGEVSGFHGNLERWSRVEVEVSNRENFVTSTNLSASDTIYTFRQGTAPWQSGHRGRHSGIRVMFLVLYRAVGR